MLLTRVISEDTIVTAVRVEAGFHPRLNPFEEQHAVKMKWGRKQSLPGACRSCQSIVLHRGMHIVPYSSVGPQSNMLPFRVKLVPKYLFTLIQVVPRTPFCLHRQSQDALPFVFVQSVNFVSL